jgi:hypothetical protein
MSLAPGFPHPKVVEWSWCFLTEAKGHPQTFYVLPVQVPCSSDRDTYLTSLGMCSEEKTDQSKLMKKSNIYRRNIYIKKLKFGAQK